MRFSPLLLLPALSAAFLIPPQISDEELRELELPLAIGNGMAMAKASMSRVVRIPCDGCSYKDAGVETDLILDFNVPEADHMTMNLNGIPIFPLSVADASKPLRAVQMPRGVDTIVYFTQPDTVATFPVVELDNSRIVSAGAATEDGFREYTVEVSVLAVDGKPVTLEGLSMAVIEAPGLGLAFGDIKAVSKGQDCGGNVKCLLNKMLERVRTIKPTKWAPKWAGGCHGKKGGKQGGVASAHEDKHPHHRPHGSMPHHRPYGDEDMPVSHHRHPHHRPHHGRPDHRQPSIFNRIVAQVLLPILVGIAAGMLVSIVGLVIGHVFVILYRRVKGIKGERCGSRKERRERRRRERLAKAEANGEVEKGLLAAADDEELPAYKDEGLEVVVEKE